ncbi:MAG TPA: DAK2 domain-containing protein [Gaiellaceae bacterium]|nr:DAK2 domain-containing protein [Gaiellaceae bacterium]
MAEGGPAGQRRRVRELVGGALAAIEAHRERIDDLNVYPVPDGDTGTNLALTVRAVADALAAGGPDDREALARESARAALLGARGNSGVILSQIVRGAADALARSDDLAAALRAASDAAYGAVREPAEGTMLTAIRAMAEAAERGEDLAGVVRAGDACVAQTRELLPVLRDAGVVDAGAAGLVELVRGVAAAAAGEPLPEPTAVRSAGVGLDAIHRELSRYRYCTVLVVEGESLDAADLEAELAELGDSLLVVGDPSALKVHVHTDDPGRVLSAAVARGTIANVEIANMHEQAQRREERLLAVTARCGVVAVSTGAGNRALFESLGARVVDGGRTMNPATADLLAALEELAAEEALLLPNSPNVVMAAERAADQAAVHVRVVPTRSLQAGLAALVAFDPALGADENAAAMSDAVAQVASGGVTVASRDVRVDGTGVAKGAWLGLAEGEPVAGGASFDEVARAVVERLLAQPRSILTLLTGEQPQPLDALLAALASEHPDLELEVHEGGQPHYPLLLGAE